RIRPLPVVKILPQQSEFPKLVGNVLPNVGHRPIRTHNNLGLRILLLLLGSLFLYLFDRLYFLNLFYFFFPRHAPTTRHLPSPRATAPRAPCPPQRSSSLLHTAPSSSDRTLVPLPGSAPKPA